VRKSQRFSSILVNVNLHAAGRKNGKLQLRHLLNVNPRKISRINRSRSLT
jgi:hypothetical protein